MAAFRQLAFLGDGDDPLRGVIDPVVLVGGLGLLAAFAVALLWSGASLHTAQQATAVALLLAVLAALLLSPQNGLLLLFLVPAVTNGEDYQPYFFLLEVLVYLTVFAGFARHWWRHQSLRLPHAGVVSLLLVSTLISFPLNPAELWLEMRIASWPEIVEGVRRADLWSNFFYVRTVLNVASGIALYTLAVNSRWNRELLVRLATAATLLFGMVTLVGLVWAGLLTSRLFLTLHFRGDVSGGFSGVGFNTSYFAQYALAYLPLFLLVLVQRVPAWAKGVAVGSVILSGYTILTTYQRGAYVVLAVDLLFLALVGRGLPSREGSRLAARAATGGLALLLVGLLGLTPIGSAAYRRMLALWQSGDPYREHALGVAWRMFLDQPLLGIGAGRYADVFQSYSSRAAQFRWGSLSSHNLYAQLLAEQGSLGLLSFLALLGVTLLPALRRQRQLGAARPVVLFLLVSLGGWLVYGLFQYTFLLRSMQVYFWIALGLVVAMTGDDLRSWRIPRTVLVALLLVTLAAGGIRAYAAGTRPIPPGTAVGVFGWQPGDVRWTKSRAHLVVPVKGRVLRLWLAFPIVGVIGRPQTVEVTLDGRLVHRIVLDTPEWKLVELPVAGPRGSTAHVGIRAGYTVIPAALGLNRDTRRLGVLMRPVAWVEP